MDQKYITIVTGNTNGVLEIREHPEFIVYSCRVGVILISGTQISNQLNMKIEMYKVYHTIHPIN